MDAAVKHIDKFGSQKIFLTGGGLNVISHEELLKHAGNPWISNPLVLLATSVEQEPGARTGAWTHAPTPFTVDDLGGDDVISGGGDCFGAAQVLMISAGPARSGTWSPAPAPFTVDDLGGDDVISGGGDCLGAAQILMIGAGPGREGCNFCGQSHGWRDCRDAIPCSVCHSLHPLGFHHSPGNDTDCNFCRPLFDKGIPEAREKGYRHLTFHCRFAPGNLTRLGQRGVAMLQPRVARLVSHPFLAHFHREHPDMRNKGPGPYDPVAMQTIVDWWADNLGQESIVRLTQSTSGARSGALNLAPQHSLTNASTGIQARLVNVGNRSRYDIRLRSGLVIADARSRPDELPVCKESLNLHGTLYEATFYGEPQGLESVDPNPSSAVRRKTAGVRAHFSE